MMSGTATAVLVGFVKSGVFAADQGGFWDGLEERRQWRQ
jgi:hypothetical protein